MKASLFLASILCVVYLSYERDIKMGIFLPFTGAWQGGSQMASAILIARDLVNNDPYFLQGHNLTYVLKDSKCESKRSLEILVDYYTLEVPTIDVYIGPGCSVGCIPAAYIAAHWNRPMVSWGCTASVLSDKKKYPYFVRTAGTHGGLGELLKILMEYFKWNRLGIMTSTETIYSELGSTAKVVLESNSSVTVPFFGSFDPTSTESYKLRSMLSTMASKTHSKCYIHIFLIIICKWF